jgi:hypothetical protein
MNSRHQTARSDIPSVSGGKKFISSRQSSRKGGIPQMEHESPPRIEKSVTVDFAAVKVVKPTTPSMNGKKIKLL